MDILEYYNQEIKIKFTEIDHLLQDKRNDDLEELLLKSKDLIQKMKREIKNTKDKNLIKKYKNVRN